jgi:hypothetical protein
MKNQFIKNLIEEAFASKAQQRFFYAQANDNELKPNERKKWKKWAKNKSSETDYKKIPNQVQVDEIVDENGNFIAGKRDTNHSTKGVTSKSTSDDTVHTAMGQSGSQGIGGHRTYSRNFGEADLSKSLGFKDTMGQDKDHEEAEEHFEKNLGLDDKEKEERMAQYGYDKKLPDDKVRLVENPRKFVSDYVETVINKKSNINDIVEKGGQKKKINPIVVKQVNALKNTMKKNGLSANDIISLIKDNE